MANDPLAWKGGLKAQWAMAIHYAMEHIKENLPKIDWPFLVLHGDADQLTMVEGSIMLEKKASSKDKTIKVICAQCNDPPLGFVVYEMVIISHRE